MKLSVIVPIYNVEKYLPRCLDSLLRQGMETGEWEVICVNDGSPDNCGAILEEFEQKYPDIFKVITQENQGLGEARNAGMRIAQGEYIAFVDSDDYVIDNGFSYLCEHFLEKKPDVLAYDYRDVEKGQMVFEKDSTPVGNAIFEGEGAWAYNRKIKSIQSVAWTKFYLRSFLMEHHIWFERRLCEDTIFNFHVFQHNPYLVMTDCVIYRYVKENEDSIMRTRERNRIWKLINSQLYVMSIMDCYLQGGETLLQEGVRKSISDSLRLVYKEVFDLCFPRREWNECMRKVKGLDVNRDLYNQETGIVGKTLALLKILSCHSYLMYLIVGLMYRNLFRKYVLPRMK